jgi:hypothetical protein
MVPARTRAKWGQEDHTNAPYDIHVTVALTTTHREPVSSSWYSPPEALSPAS